MEMYRSLVQSFIRYMYDLKKTSSLSLHESHDSQQNFCRNYTKTVSVWDKYEKDCLYWGHSKLKWCIFFITIEGLSKGI